MRGGAGIALDRALAGLLAGTGARAVRVVDGAGVVVAALPPAGATDDPATVARLVADAVAVGRGGLDDVLVTTAGALHLLRPVPLRPVPWGPVATPGAFLHLTADPDVDAGRARRLLADPGLHAAVAAALVPVRVPRNAPSTAVPVPRPAPVGANGTLAQLGRAGVPSARSGAAHPAPGRAGELPALAGLVSHPGRSGDGARAVAALTRLMPAAPARHVGAPLPRRSPAAAPAAAHATAHAAAHATATAGLPERSWAEDLDTMRRLLVGLRRLA